LVGRRLRDVKAWVSISLGAVALVPIAAFLSAAIGRIRHPFELEWMEGGVVDHIRVVLSGRTLYPEPSIDFVPYLYTPLYYYVSSVVTKIVGLGFFAPRLVSVLAIVACFAVAADWVRRETGHLVAGIATAGLLAATYPLTGYWFDIARPDALVLLLLLSALALSRFGRSTRAGVAAGVLLALAVLTKQVALVFVPALLVSRTARGRRDVILATVAFVGTLGALGGALELSSHGWFSFYVQRVPSQHEVLWDQWRTALSTHVWTPLSMLALCALAVSFRAVVRTPSRAVWLFYALFTVAALYASLAAYLKVGGYPNGMMPVYAVLAIAGGIVVGALQSTLARRLFALACVALQIAQLSFDKTAVLPTAEDIAAGRRMLAVVASSPGPVWMVSSGFYPYVARGQGVTAHSMALTDVLRSREEAVTGRLEAHLIEVVRSKRFRTIVLDRANGFLPESIVSEIRANYRHKQQIISPQDGTFWPKVGAWVRPDQIWEPRDSAP
jgi:hypothetical protein